MPDEALQTAFEIKTTCDEISRKLLRWHWEHKPGEHSLGALLAGTDVIQQGSQAAQPGSPAGSHPHPPAGEPRIL